MNGWVYLKKELYTGIQLRWSLRSGNLLAFLSRVELLLGFQGTAVGIELVASEEDAGEDESE